MIDQQSFTNFFIALIIFGMLLGFALCGIVGGAVKYYQNAAMKDEKLESRKEVESVSDQARAD